MKDIPREDRERIREEIDKTVSMHIDAFRKIINGPGIATVEKILKEAEGE